jgi:ABC-type uncharacterized transport system auxiliary subunit
MQKILSRLTMVLLSAATLSACVDDAYNPQYINVGAPPGAAYNQQNNRPIVVPSVNATTSANNAPVVVPSSQVTTSSTPIVVANGPVGY